MSYKKKDGKDLNDRIHHTFNDEQIEWLRAEFDARSIGKLRMNNDRMKP